MEFSLSPEQLATSQAAAAYLDTIVDRFGGKNEGQALEREVDHGFFRELHQAGWTGLGWPLEYGGGGRSALEQWMVLEELAYRHLPYGSLSVTSIGPTLIRIGTREQKARYLSGLLDGTIDFAIGYTEPDAGSDLAALRTVATRDGDEYVINGQKIFTTAAHHATHLWLAVRTGDRSQKHHSISVLIVSLDSPGLIVRPLPTMADGRTNEVFLDNVRVPTSSLVGEENEGWAVITLALALERMLPYGGVLREFHDFLVWAATLRDDSDEPALENTHNRAILADLVADMEIARLLCLRNASIADGGGSVSAQASAAKIWISELRERVATWSLQMTGTVAQLAAPSQMAPLAGAMEQTYRWFPVMKFGAGTNEIQRDIIGRRGLNLPTSR